MEDKRIKRKLAYQQGDVLIYKVNDEGESKEAFYKKYGYANEDQNNGVAGYEQRQGNTPTVLALGEVTGHSHQFADTSFDDITGYFYKRYNYDHNLGSSKYIGDQEAAAFCVHADSLTLTHEEHAPIDIEKGNYTVRIVREFDHMTQDTRRVWD